eukprot:NODE_1785_length_740_cov_66.298532_g1735_i0.p1 GENE.NODE_1785_length_740_cov_66.298532_g1735_i0~~NODE_1785_length_740_cov_66.298532_g1735_i0.p1  ORF type:complete len:199 (+),score=26.02 NODE_1785_length_740_cov_66.298532_g1735_i0:124-720(+)
MRFKFCGDLDCPDWVLAEINLLSKITSVRMKLLCVQVINNLLGAEFDYAKIEKLTADAKYDLSDIKAAIAGVAFIISNAAKYDVDGDTLNNELQQLGLPKEHTQALVRAYTSKATELQNHFVSTSLRGPALHSLDWRVDYILHSSFKKNVSVPAVQTRMVIDNPDQTQEILAFEMTDEKLSVLLAELKQARSVMETLA